MQAGDDSDRGAGGGAPASEGQARTERLLEGLSDLAAGMRRGDGIDGERLLFLLGAVIALFGILLIGVGWYGASGTGFVFEQIPYVVSGGLLGLGLVFIGCTLYACWWITRSIREQRDRHQQLLAKQDDVMLAIRELTQALHQLDVGPRRRVRRSSERSSEAEA